MDYFLGGRSQTYLDEYAFRYNRRDATVPMFVSLLEQVPLKAE